MRKLLFIIPLFIATQLQAQIVTDRPDQTESASTVGKGNLQIEAGVQYSSNDVVLMTQKQSFLLPTTLLRYGITDKFELRLGNQLQSEKTQNTLTGFTNPEFGFTDPEFGFKYEFIGSADGSPQNNTELAALLHFVLPFGFDEFSSGKLGYVFKLAAAHEINEKLGLGYNVGYNYFGQGSGDLTYSIALGIGLNGKLSTYIELYGEYQDLSTFILNADAGLTYLVKENFQLDISFGGNVDPGMFYVAGGFSWLISRN